MGQAGSLPHWNEVPSVQMQCRMTANLRATATCAFFIPLRLASRRPQLVVRHLWFYRNGLLGIIIGGFVAFFGCNPRGEELERVGVADRRTAQARHPARHDQSRRMARMYLCKRRPRINSLKTASARMGQNAQLASPSRQHGLKKGQSVASVNLGAPSRSLKMVEHRAPISPLRPRRREWRAAPPMWRASV